MKEILNYKSTLLASSVCPPRNSLKLVGRKYTSGGNDGSSSLTPVKPKIPSGSSAA